MKTIVMARGSSLERINELKDKPIDIAIIINRFYLDLQNKDIYNFIKDKEVIHIMAIQYNPPCYMPKRMYQKLNMKYCIVNRTLEEVKKGGKLTDFLPDHPAKIAIEEYDMGLEVRYIPSDFDEVAKKIMPNATLQSTGLVGLAYAANYLGSDEIYTIGMDFHDTPYYATKTWWIDHRKEKLMTKMKIGIAEWIRGTPDIKYHILTNSHYRFKAPNVDFL